MPSAPVAIQLLFASLILWALSVAVWKKLRQKNGVPSGESVDDSGGASGLCIAGRGALSFLRRWEWWIFGALMVLAAALRLWRLDSLPGGFNQDEASIGYDAFAIGHYGVDRNNLPFPVYPIAWGAGHGPFYTYLSALFMRVLGVSPLVYRLPNALLAIASHAFFYLTLRRLRGRRVALIGLGLLSISPWNIMLARWGLDANPLPALFMAGTWLLVEALETGRGGRFIWAMAVYALSLYAYGVMMVVLPAFFAILLPLVLIRRKISLRYFFLGLLAFALIALPLAIFMAINLFRLPEWITPCFSFSHFTVMRSASTFREFGKGFAAQVLSSLAAYGNFVIFQGHDGLPWNGIAGFGIIYPFSSILFILGAALAASKIRLKAWTKELPFLAWFLAASILVILIHPNINRIGIIYLPIIYFCALGIDWLTRKFLHILPYVVLLYATSFGLFTNAYFTTWSARIGPAFFESFGDAVRLADSMESERVYVTKEVNGPYILTLFFTKTDPRDFAKTVSYYNPRAEFRMARSFGRWAFEIPALKDPRFVYVIPRRQEGEFDQRIFEIERFKYYSVLWGRR